MYHSKENYAENFPRISWSFSQWDSIKHFLVLGVVFSLLVRLTSPLPFFSNLLKAFTQKRIGWKISCFYSNASILSKAYQREFDRSPKIATGVWRQFIFSNPHALRKISRNFSNGALQFLLLVINCIQTLNSNCIFIDKKVNRLMILSNAMWEAAYFC